MRHLQPEYQRIWNTKFDQSMDNAASRLAIQPFVNKTCIYFEDYAGSRL